MKLPKLSRRSFFKATAAAVPVIAAVGILPGCTNTAKDVISNDPYVVDEDDCINILDTFTYEDREFNLTGTWTLDVGNTLIPAEGSWIPVMSAGSSARPMAKGAVFSPESGELLDVVANPIGDATTTVLYTIGASDKAYVWVELDLTDFSWKLYASAFYKGSLRGSVSLLWEGSADYDPAPFAVSGKTVVWQVQPSLSGNKTQENSYAYLWRLNDTDAQCVVESPGRFSTSPSISENVCVLTPRVLADEGVYYGVSAYSVEDDFLTIIDRVIMPKTVKPFRAVRTGDRFLISVEASYSSGGLLGQMGTYIGDTNTGFYRLSREPSECGCAIGNVFFIKSTSAYLVIDLDRETYSTLIAQDASLDYGEYPARQGTCSDFITFATTKDSGTGKPANVIVRTFRV